MTFYAAYVIEDESRQRLLDHAGGVHDHVIAHHVTHHYDCAADDMPPPAHEITVTGYHADENVSCAVVTVDGRRFQKTRAMPLQIYHVTLSHAAGASARQSNDLLQKMYNEGGWAALDNWPQPFRINAKPAVLETE